MDGPDPAPGPGPAPGAGGIPPIGRPGARISTGRPPFGFAVGKPEGWVPMPGGSAQLRDVLTEELRTAPGWARMPQATRQRWLGMIADLAELSAGSGAVANLLHVDAAGWDPSRPGHVPPVAHLSFSWARTTPVRADLDLARLMAEDGDLEEEVALPIGPGWLTGTVVEHADGDRSFTVTLLVPVPDSVWMASFTGTTTSEAAVDALEQAVRAIGASLRVTRDAPGPTPSAQEREDR